MNKFPVVVMRGGTSKGVFFREEHMPANREDWSAFLLDVMGSPDRRQIDGMGGANSLTSKVAIIKKSEREGIDIDYMFAQVSIDNSVVAFNSNCGNISSAVAPFAVEEGLVELIEPKTMVRIYNTNTDKVIESEIIIKEGKYDSSGDLHISGVPNPGSKILLSFYNPQGAGTGKVLPTGNPIDEISTSFGDLNISIVDAASPLVFVNATVLGLNGMELPHEFTSEQLDQLEEIRSIAAELCGFAKKEDATVQSPAVPKMTVVSSPSDYNSTSGDAVDEQDYNLAVRMMSMQKPHQALAMTGAVCMTVASHIEGTIVNRLTSEKNDILMIGHPGGIMRTVTIFDNEEVKAVTVERTARRLFEGFVYTRKDYTIYDGKHK